MLETKAEACRQVEDERGDGPGLLAEALQVCVNTSRGADYVGLQIMASSLATRCESNK